MNQLCFPSKLFAGADSLQAIKQIIDENKAKDILILTDAAIQKTGLIDDFKTLIPESCQVYVETGLVPEPSYKDVTSAIAALTDVSADLIIGFGGGSVMDAAKLISILKGADYTIKDLLQDPLIGKKIIKTVMIPTTCGTGAEVTLNAIVSIPEEEVKKGIVNPQLTPDYVIIDPVTVAKLPKSVLAATAIDALCHGIECFTSNKANQVSDLYALACTKGIFESVRRAYDNPNDLQARFDLQMAAYYGGLAISSSGTTAVHALSYPLGGKYHIAHGVSNAILLHPVMQFNADACADKLAIVCDAINPDMHKASTDEKVQFVLDEISETVSAVGLPEDLSSFGIGLDDMDFLVNAASEQHRLLNNNLKTLTKDDIRGIFSTIIK